MVEVKISSISLTQVGFAIILRNDMDERVVPIFIGPLETDAISSVLSNAQAPRPKSHDLMVNMLKILEVAILRVVITELKNNTFFANIHLKTMEGVVAIDARPSDSIALALRVNAPIYMEEQVLNEAGIVLQQSEEDPDVLTGPSRETDKGTAITSSAPRNEDEGTSLPIEEIIETARKLKKGQEEEKQEKSSPQIDNANPVEADNPELERIAEELIDKVSGKFKNASLLEQLQKDLAFALEMENYEEAALLRDRIRKIKEN